MHVYNKYKWHLFNRNFGTFQHTCCLNILNQKSSSGWHSHSIIMECYTIDKSANIVDEKKKWNKQKNLAKKCHWVSLDIVEIRVKHVQMSRLCMIERWPDELIRLIWDDIVATTFATDNNFLGPKWMSISVSRLTFQELHEIVTRNWEWVRELNQPFEIYVLIIIECMCEWMSMFLSLSAYWYVVFRIRYIYIWVRVDRFLTCTYNSLVRC